MREILFRGKRVDNGEWVEGSFLPGNERQSLHPCIFVYLPETQSFECFDIDIDTLGEYTGLTDRNGKRIFEGDILIYECDGEYDPDERYLVAWDNDEAAFRANYYNKGKYGHYECITPHQHFEVIGNIHDNPELLEGEDNG